MRISGKLLPVVLCGLHAVRDGGRANAFPVPPPSPTDVVGRTTSNGGAGVVGPLFAWPIEDGGGVGLLERERTASVAPLRPDFPASSSPEARAGGALARVPMGGGGPPPPPLAQERRRRRVDLSQRMDADRYGPNGDRPGQNWWERDTTSAYGMMGRTIQGSSRSTMGVMDGRRAEVVLGTEGRPLDAEFELWDGPNNTPTKMRVYSEDGRRNPFRASVETPSRSGRSSMSIRNSGPLEFPVNSMVTSSPSVNAGSGLGGSYGYADPMSLTTVQGGSLKTWALDATVSSAEVIIETDGLPMYAVVELWGTGNHVKQIAEIYNDNGVARPFTAVVETPGGANSICIRNTGPVAYPIKANVEPLTVGSPYSNEPDYSDGYGGRNRNPYMYEWGSDNGGFGRTNGDPFRNGRSWYEGSGGSYTNGGSWYEGSNGRGPNGYGSRNPYSVFQY